MDLSVNKFQTYNKMIKEYFDIKDDCRKGLLKYFFRAISILPAIDNPLILDVGCGTGVPTLALAEKYMSNIIAIDTDKKATNRLEEKVKELQRTDRIKVINSSLFDVDFEAEKFDLIIAEGFLNSVGFEKGFFKLIKLLKEERYIIIHDEYCEHNKKVEFIENNDCKVLGSFRLDEKIWWNDYYRCMENMILSSENESILNFLKSDINEIKSYKQDPSKFNSMYYVIMKISKE
ncbi:MAG: class I SAM-dependent methyltransferase [bacterium]